MSEEFFVEGAFGLVGSVKFGDKLIHCCKFDPTGNIFAVGLSDGSIRIYTKEKCELLYVLVDDETKRKNLPVTSIKFNNPSNDVNTDHYKIIIACYVSGYIKYWHYPSKSCLHTINDNDTQPLNIDINVTNTKFAVSGYNDSINIYDMATKQLVNTLESRHAFSSMDGHVSRVFCVKYNPLEPNQLFSGGWDNTVHVWDDRIDVSQRFMSGPHICGEAIDIDASHNHLMTGSWRKNSTLQIWDLRTYSLIRDIFGPRANMMIYCCQWVGDDYLLIGGGDRNGALIYDRGTLRPLGGIMNLNKAVVCLDNNRIGKNPDLLIGSDNAVYYLRRKMNFGGLNKQQ